MAEQPLVRPTSRPSSSSGTSRGSARHSSPVQHALELGDVATIAAMDRG